MQTIRRGSSMQQDAKRVPLALYVSPRVAQMAVEAARQLDMTQSGYVRSALVRQLRSDGFDPNARRDNTAPASRQHPRSIEAAEGLHPPETGGKAIDAVAK
jgi:hypothetical protein